MLSVIVMVISLLSVMVIPLLSIMVMPLLSITVISLLSVMVIPLLSTIPPLSAMVRDCSSLQRKSNLSSQTPVTQRCGPRSPVTHTGFCLPNCLSNGMLQSLPCIYHHNNTGIHFFLPHQWNSAVTTLHLPLHQHRDPLISASSVEFCSHNLASTIAPTQGSTSFCLISGILHTTLHLSLPQTMDLDLPY